MKRFLFAALSVIFSVSLVYAQNDKDMLSVVGGVEVLADGSLQIASKEKLDAVSRGMAKLLEPLPADTPSKPTLQKISLKQIESQMKEIIEKRGEFPDSLRYLGGLTAIQYIVAVPEENDILLIGPAEGWKIAAAGNVVGKSTGRSVFYLEDFLTFFRAWSNPDREESITCSIDPAPEAAVQIDNVEKNFSNGIDAKNADAYAAALEKAYGLNIITLTGVPAQSRLAKILAASDFKMKQIALGKEKPVRNLPSYVSLVSVSRAKISPRFWLVSEHQAVTHDSQKLTWQLGQTAVKTRTETEYLTERRNVQTKATLDRAAVNWCSKMDESYTGLSKAEPVFGDLQNEMELALAVAVIHRGNLLQKANCKLSLFTDEVKLKPIVYPVPKTVAGKSVISKNGYSVIAACGGVEINPFPALQNAKLNNKLDSERTKLLK